MVVGASHPARPVLGAEVRQHQRPRPAHPLRQFAQHVVARRVDPVRVVHQQHDRLGGARGTQDASHELREPAVASVRVGYGRRRLGVGHAEQLEDEGERIVETQLESEEPIRDLAANVRFRLVRAEGEAAAHELTDGEQRNRRAVRRTVRLVHCDPLRAAALHELEADPALPDPGVADDPDDLPVPRHRPLQDRGEPRELLLPLHQTREAPPARGVEPRAQGTDPLELVDPHRHADAPHRRRPAIAQREEAFDEPRRVLRQVHRPRRRQLLHARREPHRVPHGGVVHAQVLADPPQHDLARVEPHADGELEAAGGERARVVAQRFLDLQRRVAAAARMILVRDRRPEERHDAVTGELVDRPLEAVDAVGQELEEAVEHPMPFLGVHAFGELHRVHDVGEQHRDLLALTLERAAGAEDLLGEMPRGVDVRPARPLGRRASPEPFAAGIAEPLARRADGRTARAGIAAHEGDTALAAEASALAVIVLAAGALHPDGSAAHLVARALRRAQRAVCGRGAASSAAGDTRARVNVNQHVPVVADGSRLRPGSAGRVLRGLPPPDRRLVTACVLDHLGCHPRQ